MASSRFAGKPRQYDAFLCHVSRLDGPLARVLRDELHRLARSPFQLRALRIFVDHASVAAGELPAQIASALSASRFLVVMVRPELVSRPWCLQELRSWLKLQGKARLLLALTSGPELCWKPGEQRLAFADGTPLPEELSTAFAEEPGWVDLRPFTSPSTQRGTDWLREVGRIAVPIHGFASVDELLGRDHAEQRKLLRLRNAAVAMLSLLALGASIAAGVAWRTSIAEAQRARESESRALAAQSLSESGRDPLLALQLAKRAILQAEAQSLPEVRAAAIEALERGRQLRRLEPPVGTFGDIRKLVQSANGERILVVSNDRAWLLDPRGHTLAPAISFPDQPLVPRDACVTEDGSVFLIASGLDPLQSSPIAGVTLIRTAGNTVEQIALDHDASFTASACGSTSSDLWVGDRKGRVFQVGSRLEPTDIRTSEGPVAALTVDRGEVVAIGGWGLQEQQQLGPFQLDGSSITEAGPVLSSTPLLATIMVQNQHGELAIGTGEGPIQLVSASGSPRKYRRKLTWNGHRGAVRSLLWIGETLVSGGDDRQIRAWRGDGTELFSLPGHRASVRGLLWREKDRELWSAGSDGAVLVWSLPEFTFNSGSGYGSALAQYAPKGGRVEVAQSSELLRAVEGRDTHRFALPGDSEITAIGVRENDTVLALNALESENAGSHLVAVDSAGVVRPWADLPSSDILLRLSAQGDGSILAGGGYREGLYRLPSSVEGLRGLGPSLGVDVASLDTQACGLYSFSAEGKLVRRVLRAHEDSVLALAIASNSRRGASIATGGADGRVRLWNFDLSPVGEPWRFFSDSDDETPSAVTALAFSSDGSVLYTATASGLNALVADLRIRHLLAIDVATGKRLWDLQVPGGDVLEILVDEQVLALRIERSLPSAQETFVRLAWSTGTWIGPELFRAAPPLLAARLEGGQLEVLDASLWRQRIPISADRLISALTARLAPTLRHSDSLELATRSAQAEKAGDLTKAAQLLDQALEAEDSPHLLSVRARLRLQRQDYAGALADYDQAISAHPFLVTTRLMRSRARYALGDLAGAEEDADAAVRVAGSYFGRQARPEGLPPGLLEINALAAQSGEAVNRAAYGEALETRAGIRLRRGRSDLAWNDLEEGLRLGRRTPSLFAMRAAVLDSRGDHAAAESERRRMKEVESSPQ